MDTGMSMALQDFNWSDHALEGNHAFMYARMSASVVHIIPGSWNKYHHTLTLGPSDFPRFCSLLHLEMIGIRTSPPLELVHLVISGRYLLLVSISQTLLAKIL